MMPIMKKILNRTETYVILTALLFGIAVEAVSGQFFSNTGMINLARAAMVYLVFGITEMLSLTCAGPDVSYPALASVSIYYSQLVWKRFLSGKYYRTVSGLHGNWGAGWNDKWLYYGQV